MVKICTLQPVCWVEYLLTKGSQSQFLICQRGTVMVTSYKDLGGGPHSGAHLVCQDLLSGTWHPSKGRHW